MLVYFLANSGKDMRNIDMNFDSRFYINYAADSQELKITANQNFISDYWGDNISSVTAIVGENGVGKTSTLKLLRDRFLRGLNHPESTILIYKNNGRYEMYYDNELFTKGVVINGKKYIAENYLTKDGKYRRITDLGIELYFNKVSNKNENEKRDIQQITRIGKMNSLVFQTNHWNYSRLDRMINEDVYNEELDYFDYSIGERIDLIIRERGKYIPPIASLSDISNIKNDSRFEVDYLFELQVEEILRVLQYLKIDSNYEFLKNYLQIPEELYVLYDFMDSENRNHFFSTKDAYLRFENREKNSVIENTIYDYLLKNKKTEIKVKEGLVLSVVERVFKNIDDMNTEKVNLEILNLEMKGAITKDEELIEAIEYFKEKVLKVIGKQNLNEVLTKEERKKLAKKIQDSIDSHIEFLEYILNEFSLSTDAREADQKIYKSIKGTVITKEIAIEYPVIKMDKKGVNFAVKFFEKYLAVKGKKSLYFTWRGLSSGESHLLTLLTSLYTAIENAIHKNIIILLDEIEVSMHPMWQKELLKILVESLNVRAQEMQKSVQIIMTTHSPFILSDFPLNSTILLERDNDGKVVRRNELDGQPTTLGANIHELYSHSFFLSGGLIGDYAKKKINEVADELINVTAEQSIDWLKIEKFINQVGEPIIKARLVELYNQKYQLFRPKEKKGIKSEIEELKKRIKYLEKKKSDEL